MLKRSSWCPLFLLCATVPLTTGDTAFRPKPYDWPQWQGPQRTTISRETGLLANWPKQGPPLHWKAHGLGGGYSTPSVAAGRILGMGFRDDGEIVWALAEDTGKELWNTRIARANHDVGYGEGSRCTPTVDGELLYALGISGDLV